MWGEKRPKQITLGWQKVQSNTIRILCTKKMKHCMPVFIACGSSIGFGGDWGEEKEKGLVCCCILFVEGRSSLDGL